MKIITAIMIIALSAGLLAQPEAHERAHYKRFSKNDLNKDGQITKEEYLQGYEASFEKRDLNGDGVLDAADRELMKGRVHEKMFKHMASRVAMQADSDEDGAVTQAEWSSYVDALETDENGAISSESLLDFHHHGKMRMKKQGKRAHGPAPLDLNGNDMIDKDDLDEAFAKLDADQSGDLTADEIVTRTPRLRKRKPMGGAMLLNHADTDHDHQVSAEEWSSFIDGLVVGENGAIDLSSIINHRHSEHMERMHGKIVGHMDTNDNGLIDLDDLKAHFEKLDANSDGAIDSDELPRRMRKRIRR